MKLFFLVTLLGCVFTVQTSNTMNPIQEQMAKKWPVGIHITQLFSLQSYEDFKDTGICLTLSPPQVEYGWQGPSNYTYLAINVDGTFLASHTDIRILPTDGIKHDNTYWKGKWSVKEDTLTLLLLETESSFFSNVQHENRNETFHYRFQIQNDSLRLYPLFDKEEAYKKMISDIDQSENEYYSAVKYRLQYLPHTLSNAYSNLTAYRVLQLENRLELMETDPVFQKHSLTYVRGMVQQWYQGENGDSAKEKSEQKLKKSDILGKWFCNNKEEAKKLSNVLSVSLYSPLYVKQVLMVRQCQPQNMSLVREERQELDICEDGTFVNSNIALFSAGTIRTITTETCGNWELENNTLILHGKESRYIAGDKAESSPLSICFIVNLQQEEGCLIVNYGRPKDYEQHCRRSIAQFRENKQDYLYFNPDLLVDAQSVLLAKEVKQMKTLINRVNARKKVNRNEVCNILEALVDRWAENNTQK